MLLQSMHMMGQYFGLALSLHMRQLIILELVIAWSQKNIERWQYALTIAHTPKAILALN